MMNLEEVMKEYEQLQTSVVKTTDNERKVFPHIVSKDSFERMIMTPDDYAQGAQNRNDIQSTPSPPAINAPMKVIKVNIPKIQQTSVITANNSVHKSTSAASRKLSMQRQARFDDDPSDSSEYGSEKNYVIKENEAETPPPPPPNILFKNYNLNPQSTFDNYSQHTGVTSHSHAFEKKRFDSNYRSLSAEEYGNVMYENSEPISKLPVKGSMHPGLRLFKQAGSFESDEQAANYMNALHISPTQHYYPEPYSLHNSSRESLIDSPTGSVRSSGRRIHENQYDVMHDSPSPIQHPPAVRSPNFRTYESQHHRQYKYCQRRAISLNTAPYHQVNSEQNIRRILSEEIVAENPLIDTMRRNDLLSTKLRRAASYDTFDDFGREIPNPVLDKERHNLPPHPHGQSQTPPTKIIFPEHTNVKDHSNIFTKVDDEATQAHIMSINRMIEKTSFTEQQQQHQQQQQQDLNNFKHTLVPTNLKSTPPHEKENKNENQQTLPAKGKTTKAQADNYTIGPYVYDPEKDDEIAVCVSGLLTLPGSNEKRYPISVGELRRRIAPPEYLNKVDMISYVRLAKTSARELLEKYEIRPKHHSRKSKHSVISKMCEAECAELANGINVLSDAYFPEEWLANLAISSKKETIGDDVVRLTEQMKRVEIASSVLQEFVVLLENNKSAKEMQDYNLATHSYGLLDISNNVKLITSYLNSKRKLLSNNIETSNQKLSLTEMSDLHHEHMDTETIEVVDVPHQHHNIEKDK